MICSCSRHSDYTVQSANMCLVANISRLDPSRTVTLQYRFMRDLSKRFRLIKSKIRDAVLVKDVFGFVPEQRPLSALVDSGLAPKQFAFSRSDEKIQDFMEWLAEQVKYGILELYRVQGTGGIDERWTDLYIRHAYQRGINMARSEMRKAGYPVPSVYESGGIQAVFNQPFHIDRVAVLYTRTFSELKGITDAMDQVISRVLAEHIARGSSGIEAARALYMELGDAVDGIGINRARTLARTEIIRAHHTATIQEYRSFGVHGVKVVAEWATAKDNKVCSICRGLERGGDLADEYGPGIYSLDKIEGMIPVHPNCYDAETEVFTDDGWKLFKDLNGEKILSLNPDTFELEWLPYVCVIMYHYDGDMFHFKNEWFDMVVTPNHNQIFGVRNRVDDRGALKWKIDSVLNMLSYSEFRLPRTATWKGAATDFVYIGRNKIPSAVFCRFMGLWLSDGSVVKRSGRHYQVSISQHPDKIDFVYGMIKEMPFNVRKGGEKIYINDVSLGKYLMQFGHSYQRYVPDEIKSMTGDLIRVFLLAYCFGDGDDRVCESSIDGKVIRSRERVLRTTSKRMADDFGELILKAGGYPSYKKYLTKGKAVTFSNGTYTMNHDLWGVRWNNTKAAFFTSGDIGGKIRKERYNGPVYDVELPRNHVLWVRRNGKTVFSGNCRCVALPLDITDRNKRQ